MAQSFFPGAIIDKQWLVQNSGTCNWDASYKLKWVGGKSARRGGVAAALPRPRRDASHTPNVNSPPLPSAGSYESSWQAIDPDGNPFRGFDLYEDRCDAIKTLGVAHARHKPNFPCF
jgi:hypothetical protein